MRVSDRRLDCEQVIRHLLEYLDRELDDAAMAAMARHLEHCRGCFGRAEFESRLKQSVQAAGREPVPEGLRARIRHLIENF
jgi:anti-sigma factor (TIGR02949 family)